MALNISTRLSRGSFVNARDPVYQSLWLQKFINGLMRSGQKHKVEKITMKVFKNLKLHNPFPANLPPVPTYLGTLPHAATVEPTAAATATATAKLPGADKIVATRGAPTSAFHAPLTPLNYAVPHVHPLIPFYHVIQSLQIMISTQPAKVGARMYNVPYVLDPYAQYQIPMRWLIRKLKDTRGGENSTQRMEREFRDILKKRSSILQKKAELYKSSMENRAFMHYRWMN